MSEKLKYLWTDPLFSKPATVDKFRRILAVMTAETLGTCFFIMLGCASIVNTNSVPSVLSHLNATLAFSLGIGMAVWITHPISGSVLNPALSVAVVILGHFSIYRSCLYIVSQLMGGALGVAINYLLVPDLDADYCRSRRSDFVGPMWAFLFESLGSAVLGWALCGLVDTRRIGTVRNLSIKFIVVLIPLIINMNRLFGSNLNPAMAFGGAIVGLNFTDFWIFFLGPYAGICTWAIVYRLLFDPSIEEKSGARKLYNVIE